jgi:glycosidase
MKNSRNPSDGQVRLDFPGGWSGDKENKFIASGRTDKENDAFSFIKKLTTFRNNSPAIKTGKLMQFIPVKGIYVYFRYDAHQTIMVVTNSDEKKNDIMLEKYKERTQGFTKMKDVITGKIIPLNNFSLEAKESRVFELIK